MLEAPRQESPGQCSTYETAEYQWLSSHQQFLLIQSQWLSSSFSLSFLLSCYYNRIVLRCRHLWLFVATNHSQEPNSCQYRASKRGYTIRIHHRSRLFHRKCLQSSLLLDQMVCFIWSLFQTSPFITLNHCSTTAKDYRRRIGPAG